MKLQPRAHARGVCFRRIHNQRAYKSVTPILGECPRFQLLKGVGRKMAKKNNVHAPLVLIVEDEPLVRTFAVEMIEDAGYRTIEAANADEAIRLLETRNDIRIVFTDVNMPGSMDGLKLAHVVRSRWPPVQLIVSSGRMLIPEEELPAGGRFLGKPYQYSEIVRTLRQLDA